MSDPKTRPDAKTGTPAKDPDAVTINIDGRDVPARKGEMIITAADRAGTYIPRFCYHPRMDPVGMCRMCLVEVKGPRGMSLVPACYNPVADGQEVVTNSEKAKKAQEGILEFLLVNHPLDCPVCDKGGECPLQDQTLAYGPGETRFVEEKRHWDKPIAISPLVDLDRERCIQCSRCTRFADEVAGDALIDFAHRGDKIEVATFPDAPFSSYFSGNVVQICPVGALTATPYRFRARPWDLEQVESSCTSCSLGCRVAVQSSANEVSRSIGVDSDPVNWGWLCDKGRFDHQAITSPNRISVPFVRKRASGAAQTGGASASTAPTAGASASTAADELVEVSWAEALSTAAAGLRAAGAGKAGGRSVGVIGGARLANEDAYAWSKAARVALGTDNVDAQLGDGLPAEVVLGLRRATIDEAASAPLVITLGPDLKEELPILYLRLRHAAVKDKVPIVELTPRTTGLSRYTADTLRYRPGGAAALVRALVGSSHHGGPVAGVPANQVEAVRRRIAEAAGKDHDGAPSIVIVLGRATVSESAEAITEAAGTLAHLPGVAFLPALRRSNVNGALDMGLAPGVLPGRVGQTDGRSFFAAHWGIEVPARAAGSGETEPEEAGVRAPAGEEGWDDEDVDPGPTWALDHPGRDTAAMLEAAAEGELRGLVLVGADPISDFPDADLARRALQKASFVVSVDCLPNASTAYADVVLPSAMWAERRGTFTNIEGRITWLSQKVTAPGVAWPDWMIASELAYGLGHDLGLGSLEEIWAEVESLSSLHAGVGEALLSGNDGRDGLVVPPGVGANSPSRPRPLDPMADTGIAPTERHPVPAASLASRHMPTGSSGEERSAAGRPAEPRPPRLTTFSAVVGPGDSPVADGHLRLVAVRKLWDGGTLVANSAHLAKLFAPPKVGLNPTDLEGLGIAAGEEVRVESERGAITLSAASDPWVPEGSVTVPVNVGGASATTLIDAALPETDVVVRGAGAHAEGEHRPTHGHERSAHDKHGEG